MTNTTDRRIGMTVEFTNKYGKVVSYSIEKIIALRGGGKAIEIWQDGRKTLLPITPDLKIF